MNYQIIISDQKNTKRLKTHIPIRDAGYWQKRVGKLTEVGERVTVAVASRDFSEEALELTGKMKSTLFQKGVLQSDIILIYTDMIKLTYLALGQYNLALFDWSTINQAIATKWSRSGMVRIKEAAWEGVE